eukprot:CAMPEP_0194729934 /NCGR_PEP_ID=MMETSP0296-20130528/49982_1 /TAXON_ID=39354 /ORGANISM="Heterosigma akashiwo, Strain CCMP2393" /LENGTH=51 /DNA_ID=CAMNT_0039636717 /DNA_START=137 /DNA_END=289 /DNA_ORIENTATION=-
MAFVRKSIEERTEHYANKVAEAASGKTTSSKANFTIQFDKLKNANNNAEAL